MSLGLYVLLCMPLAAWALDMLCYWSEKVRDQLEGTDILGQIYDMEHPSDNAYWAKVLMPAYSE